MPDPDPFPSPRGDEAELFRRFSGRLMAHITDVVRFTTQHTVEDACAHAWAQFLRLQPDRDHCEGWLSRTAQRAAWALERAVIREWLKAQILGMRHPANDLAQLAEYELRTDLRDAMAMVAALPARLREVALLRAFGLSHAEIVDVTGNSPRRVQKLITQANYLMDEHFADRKHAERPSSQRAERLYRLEREAPQWLVAEIGGPVRPTVRKGGTETRRDWRRAALAIDDYRTALGPGRFACRGLEPPDDPALWNLHAAAVTAVRAVGRRREVEIER